LLFGGLEVGHHIVFGKLQHNGLAHRVDGLGKLADPGGQCGVLQGFGRQVDHHAGVGVGFRMLFQLLGGIEHDPAIYLGTQLVSHGDRHEHVWRKDFAIG
jgi:hypothetical protein